MSERRRLCITKRACIALMLFVVAGAIVNVAVAWGCEIRTHYLQKRPLDKAKPAEFAATWARLAPESWIAEPHSGYFRNSFGVRFLSADAGRQLVTSSGGRQASVARYSTNEVCAGWPMLCVQRTFMLETNEGWVFRGSLRVPIRIAGRPHLDVPVRPIWPGFAINTVFYSGVLWLLFALGGTPFALRRRRRIKRGLCPKCAYPVGTSERCTECGAAVAAKPQRGASTPAAPQGNALGHDHAQTPKP